VNVWKRAIDCTNVLDDGPGELLHLAVSVWRVAEFCVSQFDRMDVISAALGIDDQHAASRVAFGLRGEESGGQLPLAGAAQGIGLGVVGEQRFRLGQPFGDRVRDTGEIVDLGRVEPHAQTGLGERVGELLRSLAIGPGVA